MLGLFHTVEYCEGCGIHFLATIYFLRFQYLCESCSSKQGNILLSPTILSQLNRISHGLVEDLLQEKITPAMVQELDETINHMIDAHFL